MLAEAVSPDMFEKFSGVISYTITAFVFLVVFLCILAALKGLICHALSLLLTEWFMNSATASQREKVCRWFVNADDLLATMKEMDEKLDRTPPEDKKR